MQIKQALRRRTDAALVFALDHEKENRRRDQEATRAFKPVMDAWRELEREFANDGEVRFQFGERYVAVRLSDERHLKVSLNRYLDAIGFRYEGFHVEDKQFVFTPEYEELETLRDFGRAHQAIQYAIAACADYQANRIL